MHDYLILKHKYLAPFFRESRIREKGGVEGVKIPKTSRVNKINEFGNYFRNIYYIQSLILRIRLQAS